MATRRINIPEIINSNWTNKMLSLDVPDTCSICLKQRGAVKSVINKQYGRVLKAVCSTTGCNETYEAMRIQAAKFSSTNKIIFTSFFKPNFDPWKPDTRVGSSEKNSGMSCSNKHCKEFFFFVEANQPDGTFVCRRCRGVI